MLLIAALLGTFTVALPGPHRSRAAGAPVYTFPSPGNHYVSPQAQVAFRGIPASQLGSIAVVGSKSGAHAGTVQSDSDGSGGSFLPVRPFSAGETVTVRTALNIVGGAGGSFTFTVAQPVPVPSHGPRFRVPRVPGDVLSFHSRLDLKPAAFKVLKRGPTAAGDLFLAPQDGPIQNGPMIVGPDGRLIWFKRIPPGDLATDVRVQTYGGQPVLTWWQGYSGSGLGFGEDLINDVHYHQIAVVRAANGLRADLHEFTITPQGSALITAYFPVYTNATNEHGTSHTITYDAVAQEIDIKTGLLLFQWDSLDHVPPSETYAPPLRRTAAFDPFHINSVDLDDDGNIVVSSRNAWAAYKINHLTGQTIWTLGGKHSTFKLGRGAHFAFQHDIRIQAQNDQYVTMFDDGGGPPNVEKASRGLKLRLDLVHRTANVATQYQHTPPLVANVEGNFQQLSNGDVLLGWGQQPFVSEFSVTGKLVFDGRFVDNNANYRAYRFQWSGAPEVPPAVAATGGKTPTVYASWNGATNVASWRVLAGSSSHTLRTVAAARMSGFETAIKIRTAPKYAAVQALSASGQVLGTSPTVRAH
jgi:Arylsulfotransferase (ASST)